MQLRYLSDHLDQIAVNTNCMENRRPPRQNSNFRTPNQDRSSRSGSRPANGPRSDRPDPNRSSTRNDSGRSDNRTSGPYVRSSNTFRGDKRFGSGPGKPYKRPGSGPARSARPVQPEPVLERITSDIQITDGKYRGKKLLYSDSPKCTPTGRKLREVMFKVVSRRVKAGRFLDLGAGAGTIGIEALSRGAMSGTFVERSARICSYLRKNLAELGVKDGHGEVIESEIVVFLKQMARRRRCWDLVYFGIRDETENADAFKYFGVGTPIERGGLLLIEHPTEVDYPETLGTLKRWRTIANDLSTITFYERK